MDTATTNRPYVTEIETVLAITDPGERFAAAQRLIDQIDLVDLKAIRARIAADTGNFALAQAAVEASYALGTLSVIRTAAVCDLVDRGHSFADIAGLAGSRPDPGDVSEITPRLSRQRVFQIYSAVRPAEAREARKRQDRPANALVGATAA